LQAPAEDARLLHNMALTEHATGGYHDHPTFMKNLQDVKQKLRAKLNANKDEDKADLAEMDNDSFAAEAESSALLYNTAALHFQNQDYRQASMILKSLFSNIEPVEESISMHICFLYMDVLLHMARGNLHSDKDRLKMGQQAQQIISFLEKPHSFNGQVSALSADSGGDSDSKSDKKRDAPEIVEFRFRLHLYKAKMLLLQANAKTAKKEVKSALEIFQKEMKGRDGAQPPGSNPSNPLSAMLIPPTDMQNPAALCLKANLEYLRQNFKKSIKLLQSANVVSPSSHSCQNYQTLYLNNMGCLHYRMRRFRSAASYFSKALVACDRSQDDKAGQKAADSSSNANIGALVCTPNECEVMYNIGVQLLLMGRPAPAFQCLRKSSKLFYDRPRLWLRMGEACILSHVQDEHKQSGVKRTIVRGIIGSAQRRRVLLPQVQRVGSEWVVSG
jgi:CCR4-NOT transcription complex subunit 10